VKRREILRRMALAGGIFVIGCEAAKAPTEEKPELEKEEPEKPEPEKEEPKEEKPEKEKVVVVKGTDRDRGIRKALELLGIGAISWNNVVLKPNFNSADPFPGSTHNDTLSTIIKWLKERKVERITVADRSGMGATRSVMSSKGIFALSKELGFDVVVIDEIPQDGWEQRDIPGGHWRRGVRFPKLFLEADSIIQTCCLKTHRFGGHYTISLKNSVGMIAKYGPDGYDYMNELHSSPNMRKMIAELNTLYSPAFVIMDGIEAFVDGGPDKGTIARPEVIVAGKDRIAVDAVGVAILRMFGTTYEVSRGRIFETEQIARAVELGIGVKGPEMIELVAEDQASKDFASKIEEILKA
jgi:uncharacterized protein (DUF362 family)